MGDKMAGMSIDVIATLLTGVGVLLGVWRLMDGMRRDLTLQIRDVDKRIDAVLLADRAVK